MKCTERSCKSEVSHSLLNLTMLTLYLKVYAYTWTSCILFFSSHVRLHTVQKLYISIDSNNSSVYFHFAPLLNFASHLRMIIRNNVRITLRSRANSSSDRQSRKFVIFPTVCQTSSKGICERLSADD